MDRNVLSIKVIGDKAYRVEVEGSQLYEVYIELGDEGMVLSSECNCPFDYGPVCKHQASVLLKLRDLNGKPAEFPTIESLIDLICILAADSDFLEKRIHLHLTKREVYEAYKAVKANKGSAGIDNISLEEFDEGLGDNLYKIWNRMVSSSYFPQPEYSMAGNYNL